MGCLVVIVGSSNCYLINCLKINVIECFFIDVNIIFWWILRMIVNRVWMVRVEFSIVIVSFVIWVNKCKYLGIFYFCRFK